VGSQRGAARCCSHVPDELILTNYFTVRDGKIVSLIVIRNTPAY
jgi:hypothetical protein